jgi:O-antigen/teichoic acid export membrane protein
MRSGLRKTRELGGGPIARASAVSLAIRAAALPLSFAQAVLTARLLGPDGYGTVAVVMSVVGIAAMLCQFGLGGLAVREIAARMAVNDAPGVRAFFRMALWTVTLLSIAAGAILAALGWTGALDSGHYDATLALGALLVTPLALIGLLRGMAQGFGRIGLAQIPGEIVRPGGLVALMAAAAILGAGLEPAGYMHATTASAYLAAILAAAWLWRNEKRWLSGPAGPSKGRTQAAAAFPFFGLALLPMLQGEINTLLLGWLAGSRETGLFQPILRFSALLTLPVQAAGMRYAPRMAEFWQRGEFDRIRSVTATFTWTTSLLTLTVALAIAVAGPWLMLIFGPEFRGGAPMLWCIAAAQVLNAACGPFGILFSAADRTGVAVNGQFVGLVANTLTAMILIPTYGAWGAVWGMVAGIVVWNAVLLVKARKQLGIDPSIIGSYRHARRPADR